MAFARSFSTQAFILALITLGYQETGDRRQETGVGVSIQLLFILPAPHLPTS
ncbi:MAG: hypothetical protein IM502_10345 [Microcystis sp. M045S2]|nr:hypothetical protein [Microcystis sp. M045S2]